MVGACHLWVSKMETASELFERVLNAAITQIKAKAVPVFTFAFYHDHESSAVSVCVDTEENSKRFVRSSNRRCMRHFFEKIAEGDLDAARLWQANIGRNLSLGDFALVNVARTDLGGVRVGKQFHLSMARALIAVQRQIAALAPEPERLVLACSSADDEVGLAWSLPEDV